MVVLGGGSQQLKPQKQLGIRAVNACNISQSLQSFNRADIADYPVIEKVSQSLTAQAGLSVRW